MPRLAKLTGVAFALVLAACAAEPAGGAGAAPATSLEVPTGHSVATFAGGCFWCMEPPYEELPGVSSVVSGYTGGPEKNPTYEEVSSGTTGHTEAVRIVYDPAKVTYAQLLEVFWRNIDPLTPDRQFCDVGSQYRAAIFYASDEEQRLAEASKAQRAPRFTQPIVTQILPAGTFYPAEEYHQDFYKKDPIRYKTYRAGCRRDRRLQELWGE